MMSKKNQSLRLWEMQKLLKPVNLHEGGAQTRAAKRTIKTLVEAHVSEAHPEDAAGSTIVPEQVSPENSVPAFLEIEDLKRKVT